MEGKRGRDGWKEGNRKRGKLETISNTIPLALNSLSDSTESFSAALTEGTERLYGRADWLMPLLEDGREEFKVHIQCWNTLHNLCNVKY